MMFSILVVAFHHHDDGCDHDDCPICGASLLHQPADLSIPIQVVQPDFAKIEFFTPTAYNIVKTFSIPFNNRAPPG
jgi:hypothetical protein